MKLLFDFFPILIFFIVYKYTDIFTATATVIAVSVIQVIIYWFKYRRVDKMLLITSGMAVLMGGITLLLHDEIFIKWKPTAIYWILGLVFILSQFFSKKPLIRRMLEANIRLPSHIWNRLNWAWGVFFLFMGVLNLYVVYNYSTDIWVNFKLMGIFGITLVFVIVQSLYLNRYIQPDDKLDTNDS